MLWERFVDNPLDADFVTRNGDIMDRSIYLAR